jgi:hypothetical protein
MSFSEFCDAEYRYADCRRYVECLYTECRFTDCRGAKNKTILRHESSSIYCRSIMGPVLTGQLTFTAPPGHRL